MATVTLPTSYATSAPFDDLTPANLNANLEALRDGINTIDTAQISDSAITAAKIASNAVTNAKLADDAVDTAELADAAVEYAKIAATAVGGDKINVFDQESGSPTIADTATWTVAHGLQDENGAARTPSVVIIYVKFSSGGNDYWAHFALDSTPGDYVAARWDNTNVYVLNNAGSAHEFRVIAF